MSPSWAPQPERPWLDPALGAEHRVELILASMSLAEKAGQLHMSANAQPERDREQLVSGAVGASLYASGPTGGNVRDAGVMASALHACQRVVVQESRLGIPLIFGRDVIHGHRTVFPIPLGLAAAWDEDLARRCCRLAATEMSRDGLMLTFAPMMDISEEPRWGRVAESLGEAPALAARLAAAMVEGFQEGPPTGGRSSVAACAKHFVGYGLVRGGRDYETVDVGENTLRNVHLRPFQAAVDAGVASVMAAFNDIDGIPMHAHRHLLRTVLKGEWGFDGVVVADWNGIGQLVVQGVAADLRDAARQAIIAGVDLDMASGAYARYLPDLVDAGEVPLDLVDDAVRRVLRMKVRTGILDRPYTEAAQPVDPSGPAYPPRPDHLAPAARALAREAADASFVLLKNDGVLPLSENAGRIHLTGPFVDEGDALLGTWVLDGAGSDVVSPAAAFRDRLRADDLVVSDGRFSDLGMVLVRESDVTIALVGEHPWRSGEDRCISTLQLPAGQLEVLEEMAAIGKPLVVVVFTGRPLELGRVLELAHAVVVAWHPGVEAGSAVADLVLGRTAPRGRLPMTFPRSVGHVPSSVLARPTGRRIAREDDARAGRYLDSLVFPELPFGYGLTYTTFGFGELRLSRYAMPAGSGSLTASVDITNTGTRTGREVVQLYCRDHVAAVTRPLAELVDWRLVDLEPGQTTAVTFTVTTDLFGYYDGAMRWRVDPGEVDLMVGPHSAALTRARVTLTAD